MFEILALGDMGALSDNGLSALAGRTREPESQISPRAKTLPLNAREPPVGGSLTALSLPLVVLSRVVATVGLLDPESAR